MKQKYNDLRKAFGDVLSGLAAFAVAMAISILFALIFAGCTSTRYVPVESVTLRTDTVYSAKVRVDSVIFRDSVALIQRGDTVFVTKYRDRYRVKERVDTIYQSMIDSVKVSVPYPVERPLTKWEQVKMEAGGWAIGGLIVAVIAVVWLVFKKRRR